ACFRVKLGNIHVFFSDLGDFIRYVHMPVSVSWTYIAARLLAGVMLSRESALREVEDVPGGEWITLAPGTESRTRLWCPAEFCLEEVLEDDGKAAEELRATVLG